MQLGTVGIWSGQFRSASAERAVEGAALLDELRFGALWLPGGGTGEVLELADRLLGATERLVVATGILNIWMHDPVEVARRHLELQESHGGRFLLGLGVSHASTVAANSSQRYRMPLGAMRAFLDALDAAPQPVPHDERLLAALGPKMLEIARDRTAGSHPYCTTPAHTRLARDVLGSEAILAPEVKVVLERDPVTARAIARDHLDRYLRQPNYVNNLHRLGYAEEEFNDGGSDRLVDDLVAWGGVDDVATRLAQHMDAGASHCCLQVLGAVEGGLPEAAWRELAALC
jgi:probable F420-dependent oxidoreductase